MCRQSAVVLPYILQVDMLDSEEEVSQVLSFSSNACKLLQLDSPAVLPIPTADRQFCQHNRISTHAKLRCCAALRAAGGHARQ
jgi:hypothetical protein